MPFISQKKIDKLKIAHDEMMVELDRISKLLDSVSDCAHLTDIERNGRTLKFRFMRNGEVYELETISMMSDNMPEWKEKLFR